MAAAAGSAALSAPTAPVFSVDGEQLTVDANDADLGDLLRAIGAAAGFDVRTTGQLGRVSGQFSVASLEEGLRRLAQSNELVLVYRPAEDQGAAARLSEVRVFGPTAPAPAPPVPIPTVSPAGAGTLAEVSRLARSSDDATALSRLSEILATAPDAAVRARAAWALSRLEIPASAAALIRALRDPAPDVRLQAAYAVGRVDGASAIPELTRLLLGDPEAKVRRAVVRVLGGLTDDAATTALQGAVADADPSVRLEVTRALERRNEQE
jgi:hypothetical protein